MTDDTADVPVYEPLYPEHDMICDHPGCSRDAPAGDRLCDECDEVVRPQMIDTCPGCGYDVGS